MLGKLLKYDFRSMLKQFALVWPAALALGFINRFTLKHVVTSSTLAEQLLSGSAMLVYVFLLVGMFVLSVIFTVQRFYKGLLRDEGYLMHTLPVRPWQLITSKLLCAMAVMILSCLVAVLSALLAYPPELSDDFLNIFRSLLNKIHDVSQVFLGQTILALTAFFLNLLLGVAVRALQMYQAMTIGHLFGKNRILMSVVAFMGIDILTGVVSTLVGISEVFSSSTALINTLPGALSAIETATIIFRLFHRAIWIHIGYSLLWFAVFFLGTNYILKHKLNLE